MYSKSVEDYLETIYNIVESKGYAKTKDISNKLKVSPPSVSEMLKKLDDDGLVNYERYGGVTLTKKGEEVAGLVKIRHDTIKEFLTIIHIPDDTAEKDACKVEHDLSPETIKQLMKFVKFIEDAPTHPRWLKHFEQYCETGKYECGKKK